MQMARLGVRSPLPVTATALLILVAACASLSEDTCRSGDWFSVGVADGSRGQPPEFLKNHVEACARYGIAPDPAAWEDGRQRGLQIFCTPAQIYEEARRGRPLTTQCPASEMDPLVEAYRIGREWYRIDQRIERLQRERRSLSRGLSARPPGASGRSAAIMLEELRIRGRIQRLRLEQRRYEPPFDA